MFFNRFVVHLTLLGSLFSLCVSTYQTTPLGEWLKSKRTLSTGQCCTVNALEKFSRDVQDEIDVLTQSIFEIGFNLQEFINLGMMPKYPALSCSHLCYAKPGTPNGWYYISGEKDKNPHRMFCDMELQGSPFGHAQGWMKAIDFDMKRPHEKCPSGFKMFHQQGLALCRKTVKRGCQSIIFPLYGIPYKRLCGQASSFQVGTNNGFHRYKCSHCTINDPYVDGLSLTYDYPRRHIWSLAAAYTGYNGKNYPGLCPCARGRGTSPPKFVGNNYFCETGQYWYAKKKIDAKDPLWDGSGCGSNEKQCCETPGLPWFCTEIPGGTNKDIEVRVCGDQDVYDEDLYFQHLEVYVQ